MTITPAKTIENSPFARGAKVVDRDGREGTIMKVTVWNGSRWYDVRFSGGEAVRYDGDLRSA